LSKFSKLNDSFKQKKQQLRAGEYQRLVEENGLSDVFQYDIFFVLIEAILNINEIEKKFDFFIKQNPDIGKSIENVKSKYYDKLLNDFKKFQSSKIEDDRYDYDGNYHDLSKSVYRTVRMRNSRNLDLNLQKYTSIEEITSKSPIDLTFFQHIDPQIIFDLWDKYHLAEYIKSTLPQAVTAIQNHVDFQVHLGDLVPAWLLWKWTSSSERKEKAKGKQAFDNIKNKPDSSKSTDELVGTLVKSILASNERLQKEIDETKEKIRQYQTSGLVTQQTETIENLEERVKQLENITVSTKVIDE
jgi:polyhydroxyalkanoate synthesis regulator phasin